jgi:hypothetical protein
VNFRPKIKEIASSKQAKKISTPAPPRYKSASLGLNEELQAAKYSAVYLGSIGKARL